MIGWWINLWLAPLDAAIRRHNKREVDLQFNTDRPGWKTLSPAEKFQRRVSDEIQAWGPGPLDKAAAEIGMVEPAMTTGYAQTGGISPSIPTQAQIEAIRQLIADYEDVPDPTDSNGQAVIARAKDALAALTAAAQVGPDYNIDDAPEATVVRLVTIEQCAERARDYLEKHWRQIPPRHKAGVLAAIRSLAKQEGE